MEVKEDSKTACFATSTREQEKSMPLLQKYLINSALKWMDTFKGNWHNCREDNSVKILLPTPTHRVKKGSWQKTEKASHHGSSLKGRIWAHYLEQIPLLKGLGKQESKPKVAKVVSPVKMTEI